MTIIQPGGGVPPMFQRPNKDGKKKYPQPRYLPSVYRYSCQGAFSVSTDTPGSVGTCRGFKSSIEHLMDQNVISTKREAIRNFQNDYMSIDGMGDMDHHGSNQNGSSADASSSFEEAVQLMDGRQPNPALVYRKNKQQKQQELQQQALERANQKEREQLEKQATDKDSTKTKDQQQQNPALTVGLEKNNTTTDNTIDTIDEDELYDPQFRRESWSAYGSTEVECLQLTNLQTGATEIVAVAPYNHALVSYRKLEYEEKRALSWQIGFYSKFMFTIEDHHGVVEDEERDTARKQQQRQAEKEGLYNRSLPPQKHDTTKPTRDVNGNKLGEKNKDMGPQSDSAANSRDKTDNDNTNRQPLPQSIFGNSSGNTLTNSYEFGVKTLAFSGRLLQAMDHNRQWLTHQVFQQDFFGKTQASGKRIIEFMPHTANAMHKAVKSLFGFGGGDDDEGSGFGGGQGPRPMQ